MKKYINRLFMGALITSMSFLTPSCSSDYLDASARLYWSNRCCGNNS